MLIGLFAMGLIGLVGLLVVNQYSKNAGKPTSVPGVGTMGGGTKASPTTSTTRPALKPLNNPYR
jgi:hypothetical protein